MPNPEISTHDSFTNESLFPESGQKIQFQQIPKMYAKSTWEDVADFLQMLGEQEKDRPFEFRRLRDIHSDKLGEKERNPEQLVYTNELIFCSAKAIRHYVDELNKLVYQPPTIICMNNSEINTDTNRTTSFVEICVDYENFKKEYAKIERCLCKDYEKKRINRPDFFPRVIVGSFALEREDQFLRPNDFVPIWLEKQKRISQRER